MEAPKTATVAKKEFSTILASVPTCTCFNDAIDKAKPTRHSHQLIM
jgi:hypothetical protein